MSKSVEKSTDFLILCDFLVALLLSAVPLYGDENKISPSASNWDSPLNSNFDLSGRCGGDAFEKLFDKTLRKPQAVYCCEFYFV